MCLCVYVCKKKSECERERENEIEIICMCPYLGMYVCGVNIIICTYSYLGNVCMHACICVIL